MSLDQIKAPFFNQLFEARLPYQILCRRETKGEAFYTTIVFPNVILGTKLFPKLLRYILLEEQLRLPMPLASGSSPEIALTQLHRQLPQGLLLWNENTLTAGAAKSLTYHPLFAREPKQVLDWLPRILQGIHKLEEFPDLRGLFIQVYAHNLLLALDVDDTWKKFQTTKDIPILFEPNKSDVHGYAYDFAIARISLSNPRLPQPDIYSDPFSAAIEWLVQREISLPH